MVAYLTGSPYVGAVSTTWEFLVRYWGSWVGVADSPGSVVRYLTGSASLTTAESVQSFFTQNPLDGIDSSVAHMVDTAARHSKWLEMNQGDLAGWLEQ